MKYPSINSLRLSAMCCALFSSFAVATPVDLKNPGFTGTGVPDDWKLYPPATGTQKMETQAGGGVRLVVVDKGDGLGLGQWIPADPGHKYTVTVKAEGEGGCMVIITFTPRIPTKAAQTNQIKLAQEKTWLAAKSGEAKVSAVAPEGTKNAWIQIYSPKGAQPLDFVVKSIAVDEEEADAAAQAAANAASTKESGGAAPGASSGGKPAENHALVKGNQPDIVVKDLADGVSQKIDFETGDLSQVSFKEGGIKEVVSAPEPVRHGAHSMKVALTHDQHRTEITGLRTEPYGEYKYGWSIFIPESFDSTSWFSIVTQWHTWGSGKFYAINPPGPPTSLNISKDSWQLKLIYQDGATDNSAVKYFNLGPVKPDRGKWTDFVMEVNWQSPSTGGGYLRLFKNGQQVVDYQGPTWFDGKTSGPFFKMGIYKGGGSWKGEESGAILYFDEARAGKGVTKDQVDPAKQ